MSNYSRRPISSPVNSIVPCDTQKELKSRLKEDGYRLVTYRKNSGNWNESRDFYAENDNREIWLENTSKGERPDWEIMWTTFCTNQPMFE